jgi:zinc protease
VADDDLVWAESAASLVSASGLGEFNRLDLRKRLTGKIANVSPFIGTLDEGLSGGGSVADLETLFQLIHLTFTQPRADDDIFQVIKSQTAMMLGNMRSQPGFVFSEALNEALSQNHPRTRAPTPEMLERMDLAKSLAFYQDRFADAGDFTFVFVGTLDPAAVKPLVERYLASLPSAGRQEMWRDHKILPPSGVVERRVEKGLEPQSQTRIVFTGPFAYNQDQRIAIRAAASILQTRLREVLREDLGGTYSVSVSAGYDKVPRPEYRLAIAFGSSPDRADELAKRVFTEIEAFKREGPTAGQLADAIEGFVRDHETNIKTNGYLLGQIAMKYQNGEADEVAVLFELPAWYARVTVDGVREAARRYLDSERYVKVTLMPEKAK